MIGALCKNCVHTLTQTICATHNKEATICRWEPKAQCRWKVMAHEDRRNWMQAWAPWRRQGRLSRSLAREWGRGALVQGPKDPVNVSLSAYVSVSPHHTHSSLPDIWKVTFSFPGRLWLKVTEVSLQVAGEKPHIRQFAQGSTTNAEIPASLPPLKQSLALRSAGGKAGLDKL